MDLFRVIFLFHSSYAAFYEQFSSTNQTYEKMIYEEKSVPSQLACLQLCRFRDKKALSVFDKGLCQCLKRNNKRDENKQVLSDDRSGSVMMSVKFGETNFALNKPSKTTSTYDPNSGKFDAKKGNDGDLTSFTATNLVKFGEEGFTVDLKQIIKIKRMMFYGNDWAFDQGFYTSFEVRTKKKSNENWKVCKRFPSPLPTFIYEIECDVETYARHVGLFLNSGSRLYVQELEVYTKCIFIDNQCLAETY